MDLLNFSSIYNFIILFQRLISILFFQFCFIIGIDITMNYGTTTIVTITIMMCQLITL